MKCSSGTRNVERLGIIEDSGLYLRESLSGYDEEAENFTGTWSFRKGGRCSDVIVER